MSNINPTAVIIVLFGALVGHLFGNWALGAAIGCGIVLVATLLEK